MMNLAINPLNFNNQFSNLKNKKETSKLNYNPESNSLMDFNCAFALKNQILFKGTFEKEKGKSRTPSAGYRGS